MVGMADLWVATHSVAELLKGLGTKESAKPREVIDDVDARFKWLVDELSQRFVILGSEPVALKVWLPHLSELWRADDGSPGIATSPQMCVRPNRPTLR